MKNNKSNSFVIEYRRADEKSARKFLGWKYPPPYDIYNAMPQYFEEDLRYQTDPQNNIYGMYDQDGELVAYCSYGHDAHVPGGDYAEEALDIGLMVKPELTGKGLGRQFVSEVIRNGIEKYRPAKLRVTIAEFNKRALRVWEKNGFQPVQVFERISDRLRFVIMTRDAYSVDHET